MVARAGGYYRMAFKGELGVTQGDPLSPTIFNVVVDALVRHWLTGVITDTEEQGDLGKEVRHQVALLYADDGMVALSDPRWLQGVLNTLVGFFDRVGLRNFFIRQPEWSVTPVRRQGTCKKKRMGGGSWGKGLHTGSS